MQHVIYVMLIGLHIFFIHLRTVVNNDQYGVGVACTYIMETQ